MEPERKALPFLEVLVQALISHSLPLIVMVPLWDGALGLVAFVFGKRTNCFSLS